jgi:prepilin-type N-terminal cleavage/methylation domain-containing protein
MKFQFDRLAETETALAEQQRGFTLTELAAVLAAVGLLVVVALPAFAGARIKGARSLCGGNLHQLFVASMVYANEYGTKLPPWRAGQGNKENDVAQSAYTRWVYDALTPYERVPLSFSVPPNAGFQNAGYLYAAKLAGDGNIFYCPGFLPTPFAIDGSPSPYSAERYSPLLTADGGGAVRSSYDYNPRMINGDPNLGVVDTHRRFPKTTQFEPHKVFAHDVISGIYAHYDDRGFNIVFTDGSVKFCKVTSPLAAQLVNIIRGNPDISQAQREQLYDLFEGM